MLIMNKFLFLFLFICSACSSSSDEIDDQYPQINNIDNVSFPENCEILYTGESFSVKYLFSDNLQLASYSIEIHNNFDHHSHSTDIMNCEMQEDKKPVNAFHFLQIYQFDDVLTQYTSNSNIFIPKGIDTGDYHLIIRLNDITGWETIKGISVSISDK